jgi:hypothetical protein
MGDWDTAAAVIFAARFLVLFCGPAPLSPGAGPPPSIGEPQIGGLPSLRAAPLAASSAPGWLSAPVPHRYGTGPVPPVVACLCGTQVLARCPNTDLWGQFGDRGVSHDFDPLPGCLPLEIVSRSACSFACTSTTNRALVSSCSSCRFFLPGKRTLLVVVDAATATRYGLPTATLRNTAGQFVAPTTQGLLAGEAAMKPSTVPGVLASDPSASDPAAYPLTALSYAVTSPSTLDAGRQLGDDRRQQVPSSGMSGIRTEGAVDPQMAWSTAFVPAAD